MAAVTTRRAGRQGSRVRVAQPLVAFCVGLGAVVMGCGAVSQAGAQKASTSVVRAISLPIPPVRPVAWVPCGNGLQCGSVTAPLDYRDPALGSLQIAVARHPAEIPSERIGSLVINPGGPGGSGIDDLPNELAVLTPGLLDRFDVVSFDPRGVDRSSPVSCAGNPEPSGSSKPVNPVPTTAAERRALLVSDANFAAHCERDSGKILPYLGTIDTARDLDRIRAALGDAKLTFIGHSYGTLLGATYAELFPRRVRAMVLDGAIDPALTTSQYVIDQAESYESAFNAFASWCAASVSCPWRPRVSATDDVLRLLQRSSAQQAAQPSGDTAGPGQLYDTLLAGLGSSSSWPMLGQALAEAEVGNGTEANSISAGYSKGGSTNAEEAVVAIDCLDHPVDRDPASYPSLASTAGRFAPIFGPFLSWGFLQCATWPVAATRVPEPARDDGAPPILVVGATGDAATPYKWAVALSRELHGGRLLTWRGFGHVAYYYSSCVREFAESYLVSGSLPKPGTVCQS